MSAKFQTINPDASKEGESVDKDKYDHVRDAILSSVSDKPLTFMQLRKLVEEKIDDDFDGSPGWYYTIVKLDLEARGKIKCDRSGDLQTISQAS